MGEHGHIDLSSLGDERIFVDPHAYADLDSWHAAAERLRGNDPLLITSMRSFSLASVETRRTSC